MGFITVNYNEQTCLVLKEEILYVAPRDDMQGVNIIKFKSGQEIYSTDTIEQILVLIENEL
jgi:hypothetical protein